MDKPCIICGTMMYNVRRDRLYCCRKCQNAAQKIKQNESKEKVCEKCGKVFIPKKYGSTRRYCYDCIPVTSTNGAEARKQIKVWAVEYKGGKCEKCGYNKCLEALEFHHLNPNEKDFMLSDRNLIWSWTQIKEELDKCILVCANCHREIHARKESDEKDA